MRGIPIIPTIFVVAAAGVMVWLGFWQLGRADEKEALIAEFQAVANLPAVELRNLRKAENLTYRTVRIDCSKPWKWEAVAGNNQAGQAGYVHRYTCLQQSVNGREHGGNSVLEVFGVIGWSQTPANPAWKGGQIDGILAPLGDNFKLVSGTGLSGLDAPAKPDPKDLPNNHLAYAGQWFFFALTALLIYGFAVRSRFRKQK